MTTTRRKFITNSVLAGAALSTVPGILAQSNIERNKNSKPLDILILGGTSFLGPHQIAYALSRGHKVTTFTRGKTIPKIHTDLFSSVESLIGDRENNLEALKGRKWDVVIDNSGRKVQWTTDTAQLLKDNVGMYIYISSVSVFYPYYKAGAKEEDKVVRSMPSELEAGEEGLYEYGIMKSNSESEAIKIFGADRSAVVRPTFMMGPGDRTDRFMYWPTVLSEGGEVIVPGKSDDPVQFIDVRDIADWTIRMAEEKTTGIFNGAGPASEMSIHAFAHGAHAAFSTPVEYVYIEDYDFLESQNLQFVAPWILDSEKFHGISRADNSKAIKHGLSFRPLALTLMDTHEWWLSDAVDEERKKNFSDASTSLHNRKSEIIRLWRERS
ncbi:MAG: NAD-dependent epimerase/dehydratase family protein [Saprospiraceae bacterium]|nr:NAD-dependent epimerase/dehydratase family protein [Saprospiraceae bacterium]